MVWQCVSFTEDVNFPYHVVIIQFSSTLTECIENPTLIMKWSDTESVIITAVSTLGTTLSTIVLVIFIRFNNTPVVKASTRELCYIVLVGMILSHFSVFTILSVPTVEMCALQRIVPGIAFAMIYGSLLIKTNRIARLLAISKKRFPTKKLKFMSPLSQVILAFFLISIESCIGISMLFVIPPETEFKYSRKLVNLLVCKETPETILSPLAFIFLLIIMCTFYAIKTRNVPENFNETKFVGFAIYTTCVIWIAFFPIYYGSEMQIITKCLCISLSSIMTLIFMFFPKIYIILLHPEKNIRALFTTSKSIRCHIGATRHSNISQKTSSSISSTHGPSSIEFESTTHRSVKKTSSCQTSIEYLPIIKTDSSCSPIRDNAYENFFREVNHCPNDVIMNKSYQVMKSYDYRRVPTSPSNSKMKNHKVYIKDSLMNGDINLHQQMKPSRGKHHSKSKRKLEGPILCVECLEMEKKSVRILPSQSEIQVAKQFKKSPIFTVEKMPLRSGEMSLSDRRKVAISEESLSECSLSDKTCKLKRITIQLK